MAAPSSSSSSSSAAAAASAVDSVTASFSKLTTAGAGDEKFHVFSRIAMFPPSSLEYKLLDCPDKNICIAGGYPIVKEVPGVAEKEDKESDMDGWIFGTDEAARKRAATHSKQLMEHNGIISCARKGNSVMNVRLFGYMRPLQIIMTDHATAADVVKRFDIDACKAFYYWQSGGPVLVVSDATLVSWKTKTVRLTPVVAQRIEAVIKHINAIRTDYGDRYPLSDEEIADLRRSGACTNSIRLNKMHRKGFAIDVPEFTPMMESVYRQAIASSSLSSEWAKNCPLDELLKMVPMQFKSEQS